MDTQKEGRHSNTNHHEIVEAINRGLSGGRATRFDSVATAALQKSTDLRVEVRNSRVRLVIGLAGNSRWIDRDERGRRCAKSSMRDDSIRVSVG
jgi:hypothetical protein